MLPDLHWTCDKLLGARNTTRALPVLRAGAGLGKGGIDMSSTWCVFCAHEIPGDRLACDKCRPLVEKLDRKSRRTFEREEKKLKDLEALRLAIEPLKKKVVPENILKYFKKEDAEWNRCS